MAAFEPLINLLVLLSALSVASERLANAPSDARDERGAGRPRLSARFCVHQRPGPGQDRVARLYQLTGPDHDRPRRK